MYSSGYRRSQHFGLFEDVAKQLSGRLACPFRWRPSSLSTTCLPGKRSGDHLRQLILEHAFAQRVRCGAVTDRRKASDSATYRRTIVAFHWHFHVITVLQVVIGRRESFCGNYLKQTAANLLEFFLWQSGGGYPVTLHNKSVSVHRWGRAGCASKSLTTLQT